MNDLLIRFDLALEKDRIALMREVMKDEVTVQNCARLASDRRRRALAELTFNGTTGYDDFCRLRTEELVTFSDSYRSRHPNAPPNLDLIDIYIQPKGMKLLSDETDAFDFFYPYVGAYVARSRRDGIVANRNAMEAAIAIADTPLLRLIRNPVIGSGVRQAWGDGWNDLIDQTPSDIEAAREADHQKYDLYGTTGIVLHDMSGLPGADIRQWDDSVTLIDLPEWFAEDILLDEKPCETKRSEREWVKLLDRNTWN